MNKIQIDYTDALPLTTEILGSYGALLVANDKSGRPNVMTIGWATCGIIWNKPIMAVFVRPSRHTYRFIEEAGNFTVNLPPKDLADVATYCGSVSGRDADKFAEKGLTALKGFQVDSSYIEECVVHFECETVHRSYVLPQELDHDIDSTAYAKGDYHVIYHGEIVGCYKSENFEL